MAKWRTATGEEIPYEKLEDSHLLNILGCLRRRAIRDRLNSIYALTRYRPGGDGASDACESAMDGFMREDHPEFPEFQDGLDPKPSESDPRPWEVFASPAWDGIKEEAERRRIKLPWSRADDDALRIEIETGGVHGRASPSR